MIDRHRTVCTFGLLLCLLAAVSMAGCAGGRQTVVPCPPETPPTPVQVGGWKAVGTSVEGRDIRAWSFGSGDRCLLLLGAIHGDERTSRELVDRFIERVRCEPDAIDGWRLVAIPVANPDGLEHGRRCNADGIDLNRNFPTANFRPSTRCGEQAASEPETSALIGVVDAERPDVIVSVHAPLGCVDYDGPGRSLAERMSDACGLPVRKLGARPGSFGSFAGVDREIPIITLELPHNRSVDAATHQRCVDALLTVFESPLQGKSEIRSAKSEADPKSEGSK